MQLVVFQTPGFPEESGTTTRAPERQWGEDLREGAGDPDRCQFCDVSAEKTEQKAFSPAPAAAFPPTQQLTSAYVPYRKDSTS